jgi:hypothetical protein
MDEASARKNLARHHSTRTFDTSLNDEVARVNPTELIQHSELSWPVRESDRASLGALTADTKD